MSVCMHDALTSRPKLQTCSHTFRSLAFCLVGWHFIGASHEASATPKFWALPRAEKDPGISSSLFVSRDLEESGVRTSSPDFCPLGRWHHASIEREREDNWWNRDPGRLRTLGQLISDFLLLFVFLLIGWKNNLKRHTRGSHSFDSFSSEDFRPPINFQFAQTRNVCPISPWTRAYLPRWSEIVSQLEILFWADFKIQKTKRRKKLWAQYFNLETESHDHFSRFSGVR